MQKIGQLFQIDEKAVEEVFMREFSAGQNWTEKMAGQYRKEGLVMDEAIYNSHIGNEEFYAKVSGMITERIKIKQSQRKNSKEEIERDIELRDSVLQSAVEATEESTRTGIINEQVGNIKQITKEKDAKSKETEIG